MIKAKELISRYTITKDGSVYSKITNKFLKQDISTGYAAVMLSGSKTKKRFLVHRLVAYTFLPNPNRKPCVNHKDGNKLNNNVNNLEWCTYQENERHSHLVLGKRIVHSMETKAKMSESAKGRDMTLVVQKSANIRRGKHSHNRRKVRLSDGRIFDSITIAAIETGVSMHSIINNIKRRSKKTTVGVWQYE